ncbi:MAG: hypothetical protein Q7T86_19480 [Hyphomicrobiaceae bacterium]|nr:hypothetical protein [Hyphomicrobiaceae bacterium]
MSNHNRLLAPSKKARHRAPRGRAKVSSWPVFRGGEWLGDVVIFEIPVRTDLSPYDFFYEGVTPEGEAIGPFRERGDAAVAIAARAVPQ